MKLLLATVLPRKCQLLTTRGSGEVYHYSSLISVYTAVQLVWNQVCTRAPYIIQSANIKWIVIGFRGAQQGRRWTDLLVSEGRGGAWVKVQTDEFHLADRSWRSCLEKKLRKSFCECDQEYLTVLKTNPCVCVCEFCIISKRQCEGWRDQIRASRARTHDKQIDDGITVYSELK